MSAEECPKGSPDPNPDRFIQHCFKRHKFRERHPTAVLKLKPSRFGPAPPRRRILIAPPMQGAPLPRAKPRLPEPLGQKQETFPVKAQLKEVVKIPTEEDEVRALGVWIEERKKFQDLLNKCADVESWLMRKEFCTEQEASVLRKIREPKEEKKSQVEVQLHATMSVEEPQPVRKLKKTIPLITSPYPHSLITLQNLLHKQKQKLVDIFNKEDRSRTAKFKREDFIRVIERSKVPISKTELEDVIVYLTTTKKGNYISSTDLAECQKIWLNYVKEQSKQAKEAKPEVLPPTVQKVGSMTPKSKPTFVQSPKPTSNYLGAPPINTETDSMHLTYNKMEEVGKRYREVRRKLKRKINPLEWAESCRVVKSGDPDVDAHCKSSTIEGDMGELVDQHRMACHLAWFQCVNLCEQYRIPLTEKVLKRALLYPGDKLLSYGGTRQKIRQPGGYYEAYDRRGSVSDSVSELEEQSKSPSEEKEREPEPKKRERKETHILGRWESYWEFRNLMKGRSKRLQRASQNLWDKGSVDSLTSKLQMQFENVFMEREMRRMFGFLNPMTDANSFWPGHLLDKLRLYLPQMERDEGDALFSRVSRTRPVYPGGIYHPHRTWPISDMKFVTYGDPNSRKDDYYYI